MKKYLLKNDDVIAIVIDDFTAFVKGYNIVLTTIMRKSNLRRKVKKSIVE